MTNEEVIHTWKDEQQFSKKPIRAHYPTKVPETGLGAVPGSPSGRQELSDEDLELIEGGLSGTYGDACGTTEI